VVHFGRKKMDCRVKPGNDGRAQSASATSAHSELGTQAALAGLNSRGEDMPREIATCWSAATFKGPEMNTPRASKSYLADLTRQTRSLLNEQPLLCVAAGLAFGAAIAALLPPTHVEDQLVGPTSRALKQKLADIVSDQYQTAKAEAGRATQELMWTAAREGLAAAASAYELSDKTQQSS